jgi:hypothetical protein
MTFSSGGNPGLGVAFLCDVPLRYRIFNEARVLAIPAGFGRAPISQAQAKAIDQSMDDSEAGYRNVKLFKEGCAVKSFEMFALGRLGRAAGGAPDFSFR